MVSGDVPKAVLHGPQVCIWSILPIEVYVLELIRFVFMKFRWRDERARLTWMNHAMVAAAGSGKLDLLHAVDSFRIEFSDSTDSILSMIGAAAANGHLDMVQWLHNNLSLPAEEQHCEAQNEYKAIVQASSNDHTKVVQWLHENQYMGSTTDAMDYAAGNGHLHVIQWLHENRSEGCTKKTMHLAAKNRYLEMVQLLHANPTEGCERDTMNEAADRGHTEMVEIFAQQSG